MKATHPLVYLDVFIQIVLLLGIITSGLATLVAQNNLALAMLGLLLIGIWQMLSTLLYAIVRKNLFHLIYWLSGLAYCLLLIMANMVIDQLFGYETVKLFLSVFFLGVIPCVAAIFYLTVVFGYIDQLPAKDDFV